MLENRVEESKLMGLLRVLEVASTRSLTAKSAKLFTYAAATLGIVALFPGLELPAILSGIAGGIGVEAMGSLLDRLASSDEVSNEEVMEHIEGAIRESGISSLLTEDAFFNSFGHLLDRLRAISKQNDAIFNFLKRIEDEYKPQDQILGEIRDFSLYVSERSKDFIGRDWLFKKAKDFIEVTQRGYFFVIGDPGIGKSAFASEMVKRNEYIHHFNSRAEGVYEASIFLRSVCAQLINKYSLDYTRIPPDSSNDSAFFIRLLNEVSDRLGENERCVIVIDALDEVEQSDTPVGVNLLYLPRILPSKIYIIITMRDDPRIKPRIDTEYEEIKIQHNSPDNQSDIQAHIQQKVNGEIDVQTYITDQNLSVQEFVEVLVDKSEGNFMYLHYVLPEIARGAYSKLRINSIPKGLENYYEDHWRRMRTRDESLWFNYKLPIIQALVVVYEPIPFDLIADFSSVQDIRYIGEVLREWKQFLHIENSLSSGKIVKLYSLYHASFFEFIKSKEELVEERVDLSSAEEKIMRNLTGGLFDE